MGSGTTEEMKRVLIIADAHWYLAWHLPRLFWQAGVRVEMMSPRGQPLRHSRFVASWLECPDETAAIVCRAESHLADHKYDLVVISDQTVIEALARCTHQSDWMNWLSADTATAIQSKLAFHTWAQSKQIPMPVGQVCTSPEAARLWVERHGTAIIKVNGLHGGGGVRRVDAPEHLQTAWHELGEPATFLIQQFHFGEVGVTEMILRRGRVAAWFSSTKERTSTAMGASVMRRMVHPEGMDALAAAVAEATAFHGLCGFDWVQDATSGEVLLLEFHPRTPSGFGWGPYAGVDVSAALSDLLHDRPFTTRAPHSQDQLKRAPLCCYFPGHLWFAFRNRWADLKYWLPGANAVSWRNVPFDDPRTLCAFWVSAARRLLHKLRPRVEARQH